MAKYKNIVYYVLSQQTNFAATFIEKHLTSLKYNKTFNFTEFIEVAVTQT